MDKMKFPVKTLLLFICFAFCGALCQSNNIFALEPTTIEVKLQSDPIPEEDEATYDDTTGYDESEENATKDGTKEQGIDTQTSAGTDEINVPNTGAMNEITNPALRPAVISLIFLGAFIITIIGTKHLKRFNMRTFSRFQKQTKKVSAGILGFAVLFGAIATIVSISSDKNSTGASAIDGEMHTDGNDHLSLTTSNKVSLTAVTDGGTYSMDDTVSVTADIPYYLFMAVENGGDLVLSTDNSMKFPSITETASPEEVSTEEYVSSNEFDDESIVEIALNHWGVSVGGGSNYSPIPTTDEEIFRSNEQDPTVSSENSEYGDSTEMAGAIALSYGVKADTQLPEGTYEAKVSYSAVGILNSETSIFPASASGGESVTITTNITKVGNIVVEPIVTIGGENCTNSIIDINSDDAITVTCTVPVLEGEGNPEVYVSYDKIDWSQDLDFTYESSEESISLSSEASFSAAPSMKTVKFAVKNTGVVPFSDRGLGEIKKDGENIQSISVAAGTTYVRDKNNPAILKFSDGQQIKIEAITYGAFTTSCKWNWKNGTIKKGGTVSATCNRAQKPGYVIYRSNNGKGYFRSDKIADITKRYEIKQLSEFSGPRLANIYRNNTAVYRQWTKEHYYFDHWNTKADCTGTNYYTGNKIQVGEEGLDLYACYIAMNNTNQAALELAWPQNTGSGTYNVDRSGENYKTVSQMIKLASDFNGDGSRDMVRRDQVTSTDAFKTAAQQYMYSTYNSGKPNKYYYQNSDSWVSDANNIQYAYGRACDRFASIVYRYAFQTYHGIDLTLAANWSSRLPDRLYSQAAYLDKEASKPDGLYRKYVYRQGEKKGTTNIRYTDNGNTESLIANIVTGDNRSPNLQPGDIRMRYSTTENNKGFTIIEGDKTYYLRHIAIYAKQENGERVIVEAAAVPNYCANQDKAPEACRNTGKSDWLFARTATSDQGDGGHFGVAKTFANNPNHYYVTYHYTGDYNDAATNAKGYRWGNT